MPEKSNSGSMKARRDPRRRDVCSCKILQPSCQQVKWCGFRAYYGETPGNSRDSSGLSCLCTCKRGVQGLGGLIRKGKNALLASRLWGVGHPFQKLTQTMPCFHRAGSELCVQQLLRAHGAARAPQGAAATHQTVGLCQSSRHWANSLRSAAGELPTETKGKRYR